MKKRILVILLFLLSPAVFADKETNKTTESPDSDEASNVLLSRELDRISEVINDAVLLHKETIEAQKELKKLARPQEDFDSFTRLRKQTADEVKTKYQDQLKSLKEKLDEVTSNLEPVGDDVRTTDPLGDAVWDDGPGKRAKSVPSSGHDFQFASLRFQSDSGDEADETDAALDAEGDRLDGEGQQRVLLSVSRQVRSVSGQLNRLRRHWDFEDYPYVLESAYSRLTRRVAAYETDVDRIDEQLASIEHRFVASEFVSGVVNQNSNSAVAIMASGTDRGEEGFISPDHGLEADRADSTISRQSLSYHIRSVANDIQKLQTSCTTIAASIDDFEKRAEILELASKETEKQVQHLLTEADALVTKMQDRLQAKSKREQEIEAKLAVRDSTLNQFEINLRLVWAVYGMIASIIVLFVLLWIYPSRLTELIVERRVVVEILSMGFLLVTVIILGSGKLIQGEGLAGLLGTIAGYIFAKKAKDLQSSEDISTDSMTRDLLEARLSAAEMKAELERLRIEGGEAPSDTLQKKISLKENDLVLAEAKVDALKNALGSSNAGKVDLDHAT